MTSYAVELTEAALAAIIANARYIAVEGQAPVNVQRWLERIWDAVDSLAHSSLARRRRPRDLTAGLGDLQVRGALGSADAGSVLGSHHCLEGRVVADGDELRHVVEEEVARDVVVSSGVEEGDEPIHRYSRVTSIGCEKSGIRIGLGAQHDFLEGAGFLRPTQPLQYEGEACANVRGVRKLIPGRLQDWKRFLGRERTECAQRPIPNCHAWA